MGHRLAVIGLGYWGPNVLRALKSCPDTSVVACCDVDLERLAIAQDDVDTRVTASLDDVLRDPEVEAVAIATPAATHYAVAREALRAGKHVFVEKPLATDSDAAADLVRLADRAGRVLMVGHLFAYHPATVTLIEMVRAGRLGTVRYVYSVRSSMAGTARRDTSIVWDALVHDVYVLAAAFGRPPDKVSAVGGAYVNHGIEDVVQATLMYPDGALAYCFASWYSVEKSRRMTVVGSERMLVCDDAATGREIALHECGYVPDGPADANGRRRMRWRADRVSYTAAGAENPLQIELQHFLDCIRTGASPRSDGRAGLETVRVLEALDASMKAAGRPIEVDAPRARMG